MSSTICTNPEFNSPLNVSAKDKFIMVLNLPYIMQQFQKNDPLLNLDFLQMSVYGTIVPPINVPSVEVRFSGQSTNVSSHSRPNYEPLNIKFLIDNEYKNYYVLWKWLDILNTATGSMYGGSSLETRQNLKIGPLAEYQTTFKIVSLDEYNQPVMTFRYTNAFITSLGGIDYSYREGEIIESSAQFYFGQLDMSLAKNNFVLDK